MIFSLTIDNSIYRINVNEPLNIAIPLDFNGAQPNAYGVEKARSTACEAGEIVGDTRRGGSCNFEQIVLIPHCSGTHTECAGHITHERISVHDCLKDAFVLAKLVTIQPENAHETDETYAVDLDKTDRLITRRALKKSFKKIAAHNSLFDIQTSKALIVRTLPNDKSKLSRTYLREIPPFFSTEALKYIRASGIEHLLVDVPSIDRIFDQGKLSNHRIFWNIAQNSFQINGETNLNATITELIYVPDEISDGDYSLNLQIAPFASDAAPSRPILFRLVK